MPLNPALLESAIKGAVFSELQNLFASDVPPEHRDAVTDQHDKMATAVSKIANEIINHIKQNMQATSTVTTTVSTIVATAGSPSAQTGTGTGTGAGTGTIAPGGFT
jgi:hypothetical protein